MAVFAFRGRPLKFDAPQDLVGKRGGRTAGDRFGDEFDRFAQRQLTLEDADSLEINFNKRAAGRIDHLVTGLHAGRAQLLHAGPAQRIVALPRPVNEGFIHHGFARRSPCAGLVAAVDAQLEAAQRNGLASRLVEEALQQWRRRAAKGQRP